MAPALAMWAFYAGVKSVEGVAATATAALGVLAPATQLTAHGRAVAIAFSETMNGLPGLMQRGAVEVIVGTGCV